MWLLLFSLATAAALAPVKDFRVTDIGNVQYRAVAAATTSSTSSAASASATATLGPLVQPLWTDDSNSIYYINVTVGDSTTGYSQAFPLLFDTGSGVLWMHNASCREQACSYAPTFNDTALLSSATTFSLTYSDETVSGTLVDAAQNNLTWAFDRGVAVSNFSFGLTDSVPSFFADYNISGILGILAADEASNTDVLTQLKAAGAILANVFGLLLDAPTNGNSSFGGLLVWGDEAVTQAGTLGTTDVVYEAVVDNTSGYWLVNISSLDTETSLGRTALSNSSVAAIIDTGTTGLALPLADANALHEALFGDYYVTDGAGSYAFLCNATGEVLFYMENGTNLTMPVSSIRADAYTSSTLLGYCASKVQGSSTSSYWILGASFLNSFYTVFDFEQSRIGFAQKVGSYAYTTASAAAVLSASHSSLSALSLSLYLTASNLTSANSGAASMGRGVALAALVGMML